MTDDGVGRRDDRPTRVSDDGQPEAGGDSPTDTRPIADGGLPQSRLFRTFPDPLLYYEGPPDAAVVRAVNPAFERTFGVDGSTVADDALVDHLLVDVVEVSAESNGDAVGRIATKTEDAESTDAEPNAVDVLSRLDAGERVILTTHRGTDGRRRHFRLDVAMAPDEASGHCLVYTDVTELRRQARDLETRAERLERFVDVAAHDLRNPLDVAKIRVEAARDTGEDVHFEKAEAALDRIQHIIRDVLSVGGVEPAPSEGVAIDAVAEAAWSTVDTDDAALALEDDLPTIVADGDLLQQLFENLFRNAVEHAGTGVTLTVGSLPDGFYVADDGRGVPPEERDRVFDAGYSTADDNTGLGLTIVQQIAEDHGWRVALTDSTTGGARFEFTVIGTDEDT